MITRELANQKEFSLNDLIAMGLITKEDVDKWIRYQEAKAVVDTMFKGMF
jgi:hypothetical protein